MVPLLLVMNTRHKFCQHFIMVKHEVTGTKVVGQKRIPQTNAIFISFPCFGTGWTWKMLYIAKQIFYLEKSQYEYLESSLNILMSKTNFLFKVSGEM